MLREISEMMPETVEQRNGSLLACGRTNAVVLSPCELYWRAWKSLLASLVFVDLVQTTSTVSEISLPSEGSVPATILVDAPGSEHRLALSLGTRFDRCQLFFVLNDYDLGAIVPLLKLGVTGFTTRDDSVSNFVRALLPTAKGEIGLPVDVAHQAMTELAAGRQHHPAGPVGLTRRETDVLRLLSNGLSNRDIAQTLFLSVRTVEAHLRGLYGKLEVNSRTEAAVWALRHGYAPFI